MLDCINIGPKGVLLFYFLFVFIDIIILSLSRCMIEISIMLLGDLSTHVGEYKDTCRGVIGRIGPPALNLCRV